MNVEFYRHLCSRSPHILLIESYGIFDNFWQMNFLLFNVRDCSRTDFSMSHQLRINKYSRVIHPRSQSTFLGFLHILLKLFTATELLLLSFARVFLGYFILKDGCTRVSFNQQLWFNCLKWWIFFDLLLLVRGMHLIYDMWVEPFFN